MLLFFLVVRRKKSRERKWQKIPRVPPYPRHPIKRLSIFLNEFFLSLNNNNQIMNEMKYSKIYGHYAVQG